MMQQRLILASASPRRRELLGQMGITYRICPADVDESAQGAPGDVVRELAMRKARAAQAQHPGEVILASDTLVWCQGETLGKPRDEREAVDMLLKLSGREHTVYTGVCVLDGASGSADVRCESTRVRISRLSRDEARRYVATGEPLDKAGAYAMQGMGGMFVESVEGSPSNVIGLPMHIVRDMLRALGWEL